MIGKMHNTKLLTRRTDSLRADRRDVTQTVLVDFDLTGKTLAIKCRTNEHFRKFERP